jgi:FdhD protein
MRTPGDDMALAAGFGFTEGIVDAPADIVNLACCDDGGDTNVMTMTLTPERQKVVAVHLDRRGYISQTGCGICGKALIADLKQQLEPIVDNRTLSLAEASLCIERFGDHQPLRRQTAAAHAAALYDANLKLLTIAEDVGRHNALDKAIGSLFLDGSLNQAKLLVLSSRISYELVQKAARARIPLILAVSRPTRFAVELAMELNITLAGLARPNGLFIYTHAYRLNSN